MFSKAFRPFFLVFLPVSSLSGTVVGENDLSEIFAQRPRLNARITELIDAATGPWGIEVSQARITFGGSIRFNVLTYFGNSIYDSNIKHNMNHNRLTRHKMQQCQMHLEILTCALP